MKSGNVIKHDSNNHLEIQDIDYLVNLVSEIFCPMECHSSAHSLNAKMSKGKMDNIGLATIGSEQIRVIRDRSHIAQACDNYFLVKFQIIGTSLVRHLTHNVVLNPGDFVICSSSDPYELQFPAQYQQVVLSIPQHQLNHSIHNPEQYLGQAMRSCEPVNAMLSQFVFSLVKQFYKLTPTTLQRIEVNVLDLLMTSLEAQKTHSLNQLMTSQQQHLHRIKRFIAINLKNSQLSPDFISQTEGISTRYLHKLFKDELLSVSRYIQAQRLEACARSLRETCSKKISITEIALDWGFSDASHFHRCFKSSYGVTPRQYRLQNIR